MFWLKKNHLISVWKGPNSALQRMEYGFFIIKVQEKYVLDNLYLKALEVYYF